MEKSENSPRILVMLKAAAGDASARSRNTAAAKEETIGAMVVQFASPEIDRFSGLWLVKEDRCY